MKRIASEKVNQLIAESARKLRAAMREDGNTNFLNIGIAIGYTSVTVFDTDTNEEIYLAVLDMDDEPIEFDEEVL